MHVRTLLELVLRAGDGSASVVNALHGGKYVSVICIDGDVYCHKLAHVDRTEQCSVRGYKWIRVAGATTFTLIQDNIVTHHHHHHHHHHHVTATMYTTGTWTTCIWCKLGFKRIYCIASHTQGVQVWITVLPAKASYLPLPVSVHQMAPSLIELAGI